MIPSTEIVNHTVFNWVEQLACFLKQGDIFRKPRGDAQFRFEVLLLDQKTVICENIDTHLTEEIYCNSPVFKRVEL